MCPMSRKDENSTSQITKSCSEENHASYLGIGLSRGQSISEARVEVCPRAGLCGHLE